MTTSSGARVGVAVILLLLPRTASADGATDAKENQYGRQGALEVGGGLGVNWVSNVLAIQATPTVGVFVRDRV